MLDVHGAVDQWIDAPEMLEDDQSIADDIAAGDAVNHTDTEDITVRGIKVSTATPKSNPAPAVDASLATSSPTAQEHSDVASVHSLPVVHVTATQSPPARPSTARSPESPEFSRIIPSSSSRTTTMTTVERNPEHITARRSVAEPRTSNRLSGFFSNLIHRREPATLPSSRTFREDRAASPAPVQSEPESRVPSPIPARPVTPPPSLPPPTLHELGLSLSVITSDLAPSHFSTPPISGTFLAPHYLLLCHAQGLDVLPLVSPPAPSPYPLVRRVNFKSVVVMEHRGVLVAIAGRRDGVRVYALEEVKKAVEWRMDVEIRRERDRSRREESKRAGSVSSSLEQRESSEKKAKMSLSTPPMSEVSRSGKTARQPSHMPVSAPSTPKKPRPPTVQPSTSLPPAGCPPPYSSLPDSRPRLRNQPSAVSISISRSRRSSISHVLVPPVPTEPVPHLPDTLPTGRERADSKTTDWLEGSSDDEAIDMLTAGASGSQALDERTSSIPPRLSGPQEEPADHHVLPVRSQTTHSVRRSRPANLDLSLARSNTASGAPPEPSPSPTLLTLRQTLQNSPPTMRSTGHTGNIPSERAPENATPEPDADEEDDEERGTTRGEHITLAQALLESRLPNLPPAGSVQPQEPILISTARYTNGVDDIPGSPHTGDAQSSHSRPSIASRPDRRRRRWSVLGGIFTNGSQDMRVSHSTPAVFDSPLGSPTSPSSPILELDGRPLARSLSNRSRQPTHTPLAPRPSTAGGSRPSTTLPVPALPVPPLPSTSSSHSRLIPRILSGAFSSRRPDERPPTLVIKGTDNDSKKTNSQTPLMPHVPPLKLEYVKLPGTKGSLMIKAVETQKKSFLAILCGDNGEKVELFAGTYRTALGLSRTFILPDSPRSLELQLQGDDLVEVFLVFSQNVFGLEPATVRVREVRIGRAERRAARRRVREIRSGQNDVFDTDPPAQEDDDANVNISIGVSLAASEDRPSRSNSNAQLSDTIHTPNGSVHGTTLAHAEELVALASVQVGPYTTFQQLSFAPKFPLATIADDYVIPPTYPDFLDYRAEHEPDTGGNIDLALVQFSPPGLPMPAPAPPSRWFYRDPKGVVHGPWKASLMQAWYKDGLLPPDLPVRKEDDKEYILLKDLRQQCLDPVHPFRSAPPPPTIQPAPPLSDGSKPLLPPISLLLQPRHFGPPALFFSSRGGHSTSIVDARGRAVLKGRFLWSTDGPDDESKPSPFRMGDVKRLEAFDVKNRSVIVAMRQGGVEAMDFGDALLRPADESRTLLPNFVPPPSNTNRRGPFVWKIGTPISSSSSSVAALSSKSRNGYLGKKQSHMSGKSPAKSEFGNIGDGDSDANDEVIFLGRKDDDIYLCERNAGVFRILRLGPDLS
ncbi:hypothetical protein BJ138DRAFT_1141989 [Hygrophoropsis aurantiaca]|uniref:Uncharacterized protein n=1 Tax=Hygrophoropsis aurantiaca TaxID=72124 RepID=A0ACB8ARJ2_9AGAM|nr:hypothetical protein BJ138DRAFT_1141989 [Hygrophoropsis aurantiaca]